MDSIKYFTFSMTIFISGIQEILLNRRNILIMPMSIESMLLAINSNFLVFFISSDDMMGQLFALLVPMMAAVESAIGVWFFGFSQTKSSGVRILNARVSFPMQKKERMPREI